MKRHELKTDPDQFQALFEGDKTFELRYNDGKYLAGDELLLRETSYTAAAMRERGLAASYTGRTLLFDVVGVCPLPHLFHYINIGTFWTGQLEGWVILSIRPKGPANPLSPSRLDHVLAGMFKDAGIAGMAALRQRIAALILDERIKALSEARKPAHHVEPREPWPRPARSETTPGSRRPSVARVLRNNGDQKVDVTYHLDSLSPEGEREVYRRMADVLAGLDMAPPSNAAARWRDNPESVRELPNECPECDLSAEGFKAHCRNFPEGCTFTRCPMMRALADQEAANESPEPSKAGVAPVDPLPPAPLKSVKLEPKDREFLINLAIFIKGGISEETLRHKSKA